jgi:hypothetical protein
VAETIDAVRTTPQNRWHRSNPTTCLISRHLTAAFRGLPRSATWRRSGVVVQLDGRLYLSGGIRWSTFACTPSMIASRINVLAFKISIPINSPFLFSSAVMSDSARCCSLLPLRKLRDAECLLARNTTASVWSWLQSPCSQAEVDLLPSRGLEQIVQFSEERYFDTATQRMVAVVFGRRRRSQPAVRSREPSSRTLN